MATWNGISWFERGDGGERFPLAAAQADTVEHRLLSGDVVLQFSGQKQEPLKTAARCDGPTVVALLNAVGDIGTLVLGLATYANAVLREAAPKEVLASGVYLVDLTFEVGITERVIPVTGVTIGGRHVANVLAVQTDVGRRRSNATCLLHCLGMPPGDDGDDVQVYVDVGAGAVLIFRGDYHTRGYEFFPGVITVECTGLKARMKPKWGGPDRVYTPALQPNEGGIIQNLIEATGIPASRTSIESSGWVMGDIEPVILRNGDSFGDWIDTVDAMCRYVTYDGADGAIYRRRDNPVATGGAGVSITQGVNLLSGRRRRGGPETVVNQCTVTGLTYEGIEVVQEYKTASAIIDTFTAPELRPRYQGETVKSDLIETDPKALSIAQTIVGDRNRREDYLELTIALTPALRDGSPITVTAPDLGVTSPTQLVVWDVKHDIRGETGTTTVTTNTGALS